jgi:kynurenine formamidase
VSDEYTYRGWLGQTGEDFSEMTASNGSANEEFGRWLDDIASRNRFGRSDRLGTANLIDDRARQRAAEALVKGICVSLARPITEAAEGEDAEVRVEVGYGQMEAFGTLAPFAKPLDTGSDVTHVAAHGIDYTHLDALNHMGRGARWYGDYSVDDPHAPSVAQLASHLLFTRGVIVDIPAVRGTEWVEPTAPVTGEDIDAALSRQGAEFVAGDALILYMGRDRFETAGNTVDLAAVAFGASTPGAGQGAARWIAEHDVSIVAWDFLDGFTGRDTDPTFCVHLLIPAIGQVLVDNCHLGPAIDRLRMNGRSHGAFVVGAPAIPRATGALVQPLFIQ